MNQDQGLAVSAGESPKRVFRLLPRPPFASGQTGESPKRFLCRLARQRRHQELSEERPDEIEALCQRILLCSREQAARMVAPLVRLDYDRLDPRISDMIEDTLYYAMTGERRSAAE